MICGKLSLRRLASFLSGSRGNINPSAESRYCWRWRLMTLLSADTERMRLMNHVHARRWWGGRGLRTPVARNSSQRHWGILKCAAASYYFSPVGTYVVGISDIGTILHIWLIDLLWFLFWSFVHHFQDCCFISETFSTLCSATSSLVLLIMSLSWLRHVLNVWLIAYIINLFTCECQLHADRCPEMYNTRWQFSISSVCQWMVRTYICGNALIPMNVSWACIWIREIYYERMLKLKSCSGELLMPRIVPTDITSYRLSLSLSFPDTHTRTHTHTHTRSHSHTAAIPSCLCRQETGNLSLRLDLGV